MRAYVSGTATRVYAAAAPGGMALPMYWPRTTAAARAICAGSSGLFPIGLATAHSPPMATRASHAPSQARAKRWPVGARTGLQPREPVGATVFGPATAAWSQQPPAALRGSEGEVE